MYFVERLYSNETTAKNTFSNTFPWASLHKSDMLKLEVDIKVEWLIKSTTGRTKIHIFFWQIKITFESINTQRQTLLKILQVCTCRSCYTRNVTQKTNETMQIWITLTCTKLTNKIDYTGRVGPVKDSESIQITVYCLYWQ